MPRRGPRQRLATNIYRDGTGLCGVARVGKRSKELRRPATYSLRKLAIEIADECGRMRASGVAKPARGTLAADVDTYLEGVRHLAGWVSLRSRLRAWLRALPKDVTRRAITKAVVIRVRQDWLTAGVAPKTCNLQLGALRQLWHGLDGPKAATPCDEVSDLALHKTPIVVVPTALVLRVCQKLAEMEQSGRLRDAKTRARFMVMASTGKRPSEIARAQPDDVSLERRVWIARDGKGGFSPGVYLNDDMLAAWRLFTVANAWGKFREGALVDTLKSAGYPTTTNAKGHVVATPRPYQLRHTVGILMSESGVDLADVQQHQGHKRIETTRRHYVPVLHSRLQDASQRIDGRFKW